jgi:hypothetical protein
MKVNKLQYNNADKAVRKDAADEAHIHKKHQNKPSVDSVSVSMTTADSLGSAPEIEYYNNYTKSGVLSDIIYAEQATNAELSSVDDMAAARFNLNSIPEFVDFAFPPNWNTVPHRGMTALSHDEIRGLIRELAEKFNNTTNEQERSRISRQASTLKIWYQSHASPENRKSLYEQAMRTIRRHGGVDNRVDFSHTDQKTLLDHLMAREGFQLGSGNGMREGRPYSIPGGGTVTAQVIGSGAGVQFEVEHLGQPAITIHLSAQNSFVHFSPTQPEIQLHEEINAYWFRAIGNPAFR